MILVPCWARADAPAVSAQIAGMTLGTNIELRLKNKEKLRGAKGTASDTGFTLVNPAAGDRQIAFAEVASVKPYTVKTHTTRNILIGVGHRVRGGGGNHWKPRMKRQIVSLVVAFGMLASLITAAPDAATVQAQIASMSVGTNIELQLKNKEKLRGARGNASDSGFTLVSPKAGDREVAFNDVASVKLYVVKSHTTRNILIGVGIAAVALGITIAVLDRCGPFGCHPTPQPPAISINY
jgi:hypothetical protein